MTSKNSSVEKRGPVWVFAFALFPLGLGFVFFAARDVWQGVKSREWPVVQGTVLSARVVRNFPSPPRPEVRYAYEAGGARLVSNRVWTGGVIAIMPPVVSEKGAQAVVARFPEGASVDVHVNPRDPSQAALIPGAGKSAVWFAVFAFFLAVAILTPLHLGKFFS